MRALGILPLLCCVVTISGPACAAAQANEKSAIYQTDGKGMERVEAALKRAQARDARVLLKIGGNWCGWCHKLNDVFHNEESVRSLLDAGYEVVLIDSQADQDVIATWDIHPQGYPYLAVLDASGEKLTEQETGSLVIGSKHDPAKVAGFLTKWSPPKQNAEDLLKSAIAQATTTHKKIFVRVGAPSCGWCRKLDAFLAQPTMLERFEKDFVLVKLDLQNTPGAQAVVDRLRAPSEGGGIPWFAFLNSDGSILVTSTRKTGGNIGFPVDPETEIPHFVSMMHQAQANMTDNDIAAIEAALQKK